VQAAAPAACGRAPAGRVGTGAGAGLSRAAPSPHAPLPAGPFLRARCSLGVSLLCCAPLPSRPATHCTQGLCFAPHDASQRQSVSQSIGRVRLLYLGSRLTGTLLTAVWLLTPTSPLQPVPRVFVRPSHSALGRLGFGSVPSPQHLTLAQP